MYPLKTQREKCVEDNIIFLIYLIPAGTISISIPFCPKQQTQCGGLEPGKGDKAVTSGWVTLCHIRIAASRKSGELWWGQCRQLSPSACPSHFQPVSVSAKLRGQKHPQHFQMSLGWEDKVSAMQSCVVHCLSQEQILPCLFCSNHRSLWDEQFLHRSLCFGAGSARKVQDKGEEGCLGGCGCMCVCACTSSLKRSAFGVQ